MKLRKLSNTPNKMLENTLPATQPVPQPTVQLEKPQGEVSHQQAMQVMNQLEQKFPGLQNLWKAPGNGRQAIVQILGIIANNADPQSISFLRSKLRVIGDKLG